MSARKDVKKLVKEAEKQGWGVVNKTDGWQLLAPDGENIVTVHKTPSSRAIRHYVADMRKFGFEWKGR